MSKYLVLWTTLGNDGYFVEDSALYTSKREARTAFRFRKERPEKYKYVALTKLIATNAKERHKQRAKELGERLVKV